MEQCQTPSLNQNIIANVKKIAQNQIPSIRQKWWGKKSSNLKVTNPWIKKTCYNVLY